MKIKGIYLTWRSCQLRVRELGGHAPDKVHTTKLKQRLMLHIENLNKFKDSYNHCYLAFDDGVCVCVCVCVYVCVCVRVNQLDVF